MVDQPLLFEQTVVRSQFAKGQGMQMKFPFASGERFVDFARQFERRGAGRHHLKVGQVVREQFQTQTDLRYPLGLVDHHGAISAEAGFEQPHIALREQCCGRGLITIQPKGLFTLWQNVLQQGGLTHLPGPEQEYDLALAELSAQPVREQSIDHV